MELLKKACEEMGIKFFEEKDEEFAWVEGYYLEDPAIITKDFLVKRKLSSPRLSKEQLEKMEAVRDVAPTEVAMIGAIKQIIKIEQEKMTILGVFADENRRLFYATEKIKTTV